MSEQQSSAPGVGPLGTPGPLDKVIIDWRTLSLMLIAALVGAAWALFNFASTGGERGEAELRPLIWTIFATPFALFLGWTLARRTEVWLAALTCFCLYFFTVFVAARLESLALGPEEAAATHHTMYFTSVVWLHLASALVLALWRALQPPPGPRSVVVPRWHERPATAKQPDHWGTTPPAEDTHNAA